MPPVNLIDDNIDVLTSSLAILGDLSNEDYQKSFAPYFAASIGKHMRHILDHYLRLIEGLESGCIDYDDRARDERIETDTAYAAETIRSINQALNGIKVKLESVQGFAKQAVDVNLCTSASASRDDGDAIASSVERELVFVHGHTTHHYAIIAAILKMLEVPVSADFGVAPSTLVYEKGLECAR